MIVDHLRNPYHDSFCRCRSCKPPRQRMETTRRVELAAVGLGIVTAIAAVAGRIQL